MSLLIQRLIDDFSESRELAISVIVHAILLAILAQLVIKVVVQEPPQVPPQVTFIQPATSPPAPQPPAPGSSVDYNFTSPGTTATSSDIVDILRTNAPNSPPVDSISFAPITSPLPSRNLPEPAPGPPGGTTPGATPSWRPPNKPDGVLEFTACVGQYAGGNWDSTLRFRDGKIEAGSVPNLLYFISENSRKKIKANHADVRVVRLDSDEILAIKPPFILLTGTKDFTLTDKEVDTLAAYVRWGGCIWGDSSVPGPRSRFDIAFRREMKRVVPDKNEEFKPLPADHPVFRDGYFSEIKQPPPGLNYYREPVYALNVRGKIAVLYTANDYGDMWQTGLNKEGQIDLRKNAADSYVAINPTIWDNRDIYLRNINPESLVNCFKFGTNVVVYLLTRFEKERNAPAL